MFRNRNINPLTGLPMGYLPGNTVAPSLQAKADASVARQIAADPRLQPGYSPLLQGPANKSVTKADEAPSPPPQTPAQALFPSGPASQAPRIEPMVADGDGPFSDAAYERSRARMAGPSDKEAHDDHMNRLTRLGDIHPNYLWGLDPDGNAVTPESAKVAEGKLQYSGKRPQGAVPFGYSTP